MTERGNELSLPSALYHVPSTQTIILRIAFGADMSANKLDSTVGKVGRCEFQDAEFKTRREMERTKESFKPDTWCRNPSRLWLKDWGP